MRSKSCTGVLLPLLLICVHSRAFAQPTSQPVSVVRVAAIGEINDFDFWKELSARFEKQTGIHVQTVATGNKDGVAASFKQGGIDLLTMPLADVVMGLVAEGYATDPQPWLQMDLAIVGPSTDPAGIKGMTDAAAAIRKILQSKNELLIHGSLGADQVVRAIAQADRTSVLDTSKATILLGDHQKQVFQAAVQKQAYTLIARVPFRSGKLGGEGYAVMVEGSPMLRRPIVAAIANDRVIAGVRTFEARRLLQFLRSADTQNFVSTFGAGKIDPGPLFFAVTDASSSSAQNASPLRVDGEIPNPLDLNLDALAKLPRQTVRTKDHSGADATYEGVLVRDVLKLAGAPLGNDQMRGPNLGLYLVVEAADGYRAIFSLAELDDDFAERSILLADRRDGKMLEGSEGPLRLIVPQDARPARWVRRVIRLHVSRD